MPFSLQDLLTQMDQTDLSSSPSDDLKEQLKAQLRSSFGIPDDEDEKPKPSDRPKEPKAPKSVMPAVQDAGVIKQPEATKDSSDSGTFLGFGENPQTHARTFLGSEWLPWLAAQGVRLGGGLLSAEGGVPGAAISGGAEGIAQKLESTNPIDAGKVAIEGGIGAIPFGKIVKGIKPTIGVAEQLAANAGRMAGYVEGGNMLRRMYDNSDVVAPVTAALNGNNPEEAAKFHIGNPLPTDARSIAMDTLSTLVGAKLANLHPQFEGTLTRKFNPETGYGDAFIHQPGRTVKSAINDLTTALETNLGSEAGAEPRLIKNTEARGKAGKRGGVDIVPSDLVEKAETNLEPTAQTVGGAYDTNVHPVEGLRIKTADYPAVRDTDVLKDANGNVIAHRTEDLPTDPLEYAEVSNTKNIEGIRLPQLVQMQLDNVDKRASKIPMEWLDEQSNPINDRAVAMMASEQASKDLAKRNILEKYYESAGKEEDKLSKAESAADREFTRNSMGSNDLSKIKTAEEKAAAEAEETRRQQLVDVEKAHQQANDLRAKEAADKERAFGQAMDERVAADKAQQTANDMLDKEHRQARAQAAIDNALAEMEPGRPSITEVTERVPTSTGTQTMRQSFFPKAEEEGDLGGVEIEPAPRAPKASATNPRPSIPKTDPANVARSTYPTQMDALHALAGSGERGDVQRMGRGKWRVIFDKEPVATEAATLVAEAKPIDVATETPKTVVKTQTTAAPETNAANIEAEVNRTEPEVGTNPPEEPPAAAPVAKPEPKPKGPAPAAVQPEGEATPGIGSQSAGNSATDARLRRNATRKAKAAQMPNKIAKMTKAEADAITREDVQGWSQDELETAAAKFGRDKRILGILKDEYARRQAEPEVKTPPPADEEPPAAATAPLKPAPKGPAGPAAAETEAPAPRVKHPDDDMPVGGKRLIVSVDKKGNTSAIVGTDEAGLSQIYNGWKNTPNIIKVGSNGKLPKGMTKSGIIRYLAEKYNVKPENVNFTLHGQEPKVEAPVAEPKVAPEASKIAPEAPAAAGKGEGRGVPAEASKTAPKPSEGVSEKATATFAYHDPTVGKDYYHIEGGAGDKSTVTADELQKRGIEVPAKPNLNSSEELAKRYPKGATVNAYGSEGTVLTHSDGNVRVKFTNGRMVEAQGAKGFFDVAPDHIQSTTVPASEPKVVEPKITPTAEPKATEPKVTDADMKAEFQKFTDRELLTIKNKTVRGPNDVRMADLAQAEMDRRAAEELSKAPKKGVRVAPKAEKTKTSVVPRKDLDKAVMDATEAGKDVSIKSADADGNTWEVTTGPKGSIEKPEKPNLSTTRERVIVDTDGAKNSGDVHKRVLNALKEYKAKVDAAEADTGVNEKGERIYNTPPPKTLELTIPNGPTYIIAPNQIDEAIKRFSSGEAGPAFKGIVDKTPQLTERQKLGFSSPGANKPIIVSDADAKALMLEHADIRAHNERVGPTAVSKEHTPNAVVVKKIGLDEIPKDASAHIYRMDKDGNVSILIGDESALNRVAAQNKETGHSKLRVDNLPENTKDTIRGQIDKLIKAGKIDKDKLSIGLATDKGSFEPLGPESTPPTGGGGAKPAPKKAGLRVKGKAADTGEVSIKKGKTFSEDGTYDVTLPNGKKTGIFYDGASQTWYENVPTKEAHTSHYSDLWGHSKEELIDKLKAREAGAQLEGSVDRKLEPPTQPTTPEAAAEKVEQGKARTQKLASAEAQTDTYRVSRPTNRRGVSSYIRIGSDGTPEWTNIPSEASLLTKKQVAKVVDDVGENLRIQKSDFSGDISPAEVKGYVGQDANDEAIYDAKKAWSNAASEPTTKDGLTKAQLLERHGIDPTSSTNDLMLHQQSAADEYFRLKELAKTDKSPETQTALRTAGAKYGNLKAATALAAKEEGQIARGAVEPSALPKPKAGLSSDDIARMHPDDQENVLKDIVSKFKSKAKDALIDENGAVQPHIAARMGLSAVGALAGAAMTPDDPMTGAILGGTLGWAGPSVYRAVASHVRSLPEGPVKAKSDKAVGAWIHDRLKGLAEIVPNYYRASYLSKIPNLMMNSFVGPYGAAFMGALEHSLGGDERGTKALKELITYGIGPAKFVKNVFTEGIPESRRIVTAAEERGDVIGKPKGLTKEIVTAPATLMTAGDVTARNILMRAGFTELEARRITGTSEPLSGISTSLGAFRKAKGRTGKASWVAQMALPFYRTNANFIEQQLLRTPIGGALRKSWNLAPVSTRMKVAQLGLTTATMGGAFALGTQINPTTAPLVYKALTNFGGVYGPGIGAALLAGVAYQKKDLGDAALSGMLQFMRRDAPMPTMDAFTGWARFILYDAPRSAYRMSQGKAPDITSLPYGTIPAPLSSKEAVSIPTAERFVTGDRNYDRPTKKEYSVFVPLVDRPQLKPAPKSNFQLTLERLKAQRANQRKQAKENNE